MKIEETVNTLIGGDKTLDLTTGKFNGRACLNPGKMVHRLLLHLFTESQPSSVSAVFAAVFPDEVFESEISAMRVHQLVYRTRKFLSEEGIPVRITERQGLYKVEVDGGLQVVMRQAGRPKHWQEVQLNRLTDKYAQGAFSAREAQADLGVSLSTLNRILRFGVRKGMIVRLGAGPKTRYLFERRQHPRN